MLIIALLSYVYAVQINNIESTLFVLGFFFFSVEGSFLPLFPLFAVLGGLLVLV